MFVYLLYNAGSYLARVLPPKLSDVLGWLIGQGSCLIRQGTRRIIEHNLNIIHGGSLSDRELRRGSRRVVMNFARAIVVFLKLPSYKWDEIRKITDMSQFEAAIDGMGKHPVFLVASVHMGPWELGGLFLSRLGFKLHTVALDHPSEQVTRFFDKRRRSIGIINHPMRNSYPILKAALQNGESVVLLTDRVYSASYKRFRFFGVQGKFPLGHLYLSASCGVPILTGAMVFDGAGNRFKYIHGGIHQPPPDGTEDMDKLEELQARCLEDFEKIIREHSDQWFHFEPLADSGEHDD